MSEASEGTGRSVEAHYGAEDLLERILEALEAAGHDPQAPSPEALAGVEEFHIRGREATRELVELGGITPDMHALDVGCGLGGPARALAREVGCRVTCLDLTEAYCRTAEALTARAALGDSVDFHCGDACAMPFDDAAFDVVWTQHVSMNVADKEAFYRELRRVLRPGGRLVMYEIIADSGEPLHFPVPWAPDASISFLADADALRQGLARHGLTIQTWRDVSDPAVEWFDAMLERVEREGPPPIGLHLLLGPEMKTMAANVRRNIASGRIRIVQLVAQG